MIDLDKFDGHTWGPWWACCENSEAHFVFAGEGDGPTICALKSNDPNHGEYESMSEILTMDERRANAKLIASAPDLIKEIKALREWRLAITAAHDRFYTETDNYTAAGQGFILPYKHFVEAWNAAEAKLKLEGG